MNTLTKIIGTSLLGIGLLGTKVASAETISLWYQRGANADQQKALQDALGKPFEAVNPGKQLDIQYRGSSADKQIRIAMLSGHGPDLVMTPGPTYVVPMVRAGQLLPLDNYARKYGWYDKVIGPLLQTGVDHGHLYALPRSYETMFLFYNQTLFDQNGWKPPTNLPELTSLAQAMMAKGITPFGAGNQDWRGANEWYVGIILNHYAGPENVYKALRGELPWDAPVFVDAIKLLHDWYKQGWFGKSYFSLTLEQGFARVAENQAGMSPNGNWAFTFAATHFPVGGKQKPGAAPFPSLREGVASPLYVLGVGSTMSINKDSTDPDAAAAVLDRMYSQGFFQDINKTWGPGDWNVPLVTIDLKQLATDTTPLFASLIGSLSEAVKHGSYGYTTWVFWPPATDEYLINGIEQVWLDRITPEQYLAKMNAVFQEEQKAGKVPPLPPR